MSGELENTESAESVEVESTDAPAAEQVETDGE